MALYCMNFGREGFVCRRHFLAILLILALPQLASAQYAEHTNFVGDALYGSPQLGRSLAISGDGASLIVGAPAATTAASYPLMGIGKAWVYRRTGGAWSVDAVLGVENFSFQQGYSVSISGDGNTAIVGGPGDGFTPGQARIYARVGGHWTEQAVLSDNTAYWFAHFGWSVGLSNDGNTAIVGGPFEGGMTNVSGAAWVFKRAAGGWVMQGPKLIASDASGNALQGYSVALSGDGATALVGGPQDSAGAGAAWVWSRRPDGTWAQDGKKLVGSGAANAANLGYSVALSRAGHIALAGGPSDGGGVGASWLFQRRQGGWRQDGAKLVGSGVIGEARQGSSVALSRDGVTALIGGPGDNQSVGAAWSFTRWNGAWLQQGAKLASARAVGKSEQGKSVSLSGSGNIAAVGGPLDNQGAGAAWVYYRSFAGAPRVASCYTDSIGALTSRFGGLNTAAWSLGYGMANVSPLQSAIHAYCADRGAARG